MTQDCATRTAFGRALVALGASHPEVVVIDDDVATSVMTADFGKAYPSRFFEVGIAESNAIGIAAGLAMAGKVAFVASFAAFITGRFETIRMSVGYNRTNVRLVGTHVGIGIGEDGHSQMGLEDVALMRTVPNMAVIQPGSGIEAEQATAYLGDHIGPAYLRLTRQKVKEVYPDGYRFEFGKGVLLREGSDVALLATGAGVGEALGAADILAGHGISAAVANIHTIQPLDDEFVAGLASQCGRVVTVEDHTPVGGLGGAVCESLAARRPAPVLRIGVEGFGESGDVAELYDKFGLSSPKIAARVASFLESAAEVVLNES